jgi:TolA-binding protein
MKNSRIPVLVSGLVLAWLGMVATVGAQSALERLEAEIRQRTGQGPPPAAQPAPPGNSPEVIPLPPAEQIPPPPPANPPGELSTSAPAGNVAAERDRIAQLQRRIEQLERRVEELEKALKTRNNSP